MEVLAKSTKVPQLLASRKESVVEGLLMAGVGVHVSVNDVHFSRVNHHEIKCSIIIVTNCYIVRLLIMSERSVYSLRDTLPSAPMSRFTHRLLTLDQAETTLMMEWCVL